MSNVAWAILGSSRKRTTKAIPTTDCTDNTDVIRGYLTRWPLLFCGSFLLQLLGHFRILFANHLQQFLGHLRKRLQAKLHRAVAGLGDGAGDDRIHLTEVLRVLAGIVVAELAAAAFLPHQ